LRAVVVGILGEHFLTVGAIVLKYLAGLDNLVALRNGVVLVGVGGDGGRAGACGDAGEEVAVGFVGAGLSPEMLGGGPKKGPKKGSG
jgi:hypothetical protein